MTVTDLNRLLSVLLTSPQMQALWHIRDRGVPVFAHTIDVTLLCLSAYPEQRRVHPSLDLAVIVLGSLFHDMSKLTARRELGVSHSHIMTREPALAIVEAARLLDWAQRDLDLSLDPAMVEHVWHVVQSHHGPWGKVKPATPEARLVHECDLYSATHHRMAPIDANDILPLLRTGRRWRQVGAKLGVSRDVIKSRLREACVAERVRDWPDLIPIWEQHGRVAVGSTTRAQQLEHVRQVIALAHQVPDCLTLRIAKLAAGAHDHAPVASRNSARQAEPVEVQA